MTAALKILLLEDSRTDAAMIRHVLLKEKLPIELRLVMNRSAFLEGLDTFQPDLILSDNSLPQFSATEALEILHQKALQIPFILVTGTVSEEFAAGIIKLGADDYILKDRLIRLPSAIDNALKQNRAEKEKREAIQKLTQSEENLTTIFENTSEGFILVDRECIVKAFNENGRRYVFSNTRKEITTGEGLLNFVPPASALIVKEALDKVMEGEKIQYDYLQENEGGLLWLSLTIMPVLKNGKTEGACITGRDITERKKSEEVRRAMEIQEQKKIARAIIGVQEKERNYIGQELHDNVNQILAAIKIHMDKAGQSNPVVEKSMAYPTELLELCMQEIRLLSRKLVTPANNINLQDMLRAILDSLTENTSMRTSLAYDVPAALDNDDDLKLNVYRIIQEQVNNIIKHAHAGEVSISVQGADNCITIIVTDDGQGFEVNQKRKGIGISNMINRVKSFNGEVQLQSSPGSGCKLQIVIPWREQLPG